MTEEDKRTERQAMADRSADFIAAAMMHLHRDCGIPLDVVAAGAHGATVAAMAQIVGGPATAACCERAAKRVRNLPSAAAMALAYATPAGRA